MKRSFLIILVVTAFLMGLAGQAMAYFEMGNLIRVVYTKSESGGQGNLEVVTDLGSGLNPTTATAASRVLSTNNFSLSQLGVTDWSNVYVAYFTMTTTSPYSSDSGWISGNRSSGQSSSGSTSDSTYNNYETIRGSNSALAASEQSAMIVGSQSNAWSYTSVMGLDGTFGGFLTTSNLADANLSNLATVGYVDQWLYYYASTGAGAYGTQVYKLRTYADGHTEINPVPLPAAVYLFGSGLLAIAGFRGRRLSLI